jgi:hypothetical protein
MLFGASRAGGKVNLLLIEQKNLFPDLFGQNY